MGDFERRSLEQMTHEPLARLGRLIFEHPWIGPTGGTVDGDKKVLPALPVRHLRQVFDVHMNEARVIRLEARLGRFLTLYGGFTRLDEHFEVRYAMSMQAAIEARAGGYNVDELVSDRQQCGQGQQAQCA
jgi:hypothetical protein